MFYLKNYTTQLSSDFHILKDSFCEKKVLQYLHSYRNIIDE